MTTSLLMALAGAVVIFVGTMLLMPKSVGRNVVQRRRGLLTDLERGRQETLSAAVESMNSLQAHDYTLRDALEDLSPLGQTIVRLPFMLYFYRMIVQSGLQKEAGITAFGILVITIVITFVLIHLFGILTIPFGIGAGLFIGRAYLMHRVNKRNRKFMDRFADGIDMIVRAIRAGNPVNSSLRLVAEHGESPVKDEFRILVDEVTYGRPLVEALARMAKRVPEYDVSFFVVVLTVQQETGGNLGEVLGKLSYIIRKRQELFLRVRAITSEGRATAWILGCLPIFLMVTLYFLSPDYLMPLFVTKTGHIILFFAFALIGFGFYVIRKMSQIEV